MANLVYNEGKKRILNAFAAPVDLSALRVMLVQSTYAADADHAAIDDGTAADPASHELTVVGYSRQVLAGLVVGKDVSLDIAYLDASDVVFDALAVGQTIGGAILYLHTGVDTTSIPLCFYDLADTPTNGSSITIRWADVAAGGLLKAA